METQNRVGGLSHHERLDRLAEIAVHIGLGIQPGQQLILSAPIQALELADLITEHAYRAGASLVTPFYTNDRVTLARYMHACDESFDVTPKWLFKGMSQAFREGAARLSIGGSNPELLKGQDSERIKRSSQAYSKATNRVGKFITLNVINWTYLAYATPAWAKAVFPDCPEDEAVAKLWDAIFTVSRVDEPDPVAAWEAHNLALHARAAWLNEKNYAALHFSGPGTDLTVGLAEGHLWAGGAEATTSGIVFNPNIPSEEVFTTPHRSRVDGVVAGTKPLVYQGTMIHGMRARYSRGRIVEATADEGQDVFLNMINTDAGARRIGEVALVPISSPAAKAGILFKSTLFDENAASHLAQGECYSSACMRGGTNLQKRELIARGANFSSTHVDWMIGSEKIDVDGITASGQPEPIMRKGEWV